MPAEHSVREAEHTPLNRTRLGAVHDVVEVAHRQEHVDSSSAVGSQEHGSHEVVAVTRARAGPSSGLPFSMKTRSASSSGDVERLSTITIVMPCALSSSTTPSAPTTSGAS